MPAAGGVECDVVVRAVQVGAVMQLNVGLGADRLGARNAAPLGVKAQRVGRQRLVVELVVDVKPESRKETTERRVAAVLDGDARVTGERHRKIGVQTVRCAEARIHAHAGAAELSHARVREAEEVAQRHLDGRRRLAVPKATQDRVAVVGQRWQDHRTVEMRHASRSLDVEQYGRLAAADENEVAVAPAAVPRRRAQTARAARDRQRPERMKQQRMVVHHASSIAYPVRRPSAGEVFSQTRLRADIAAWAPRYRHHFSCRPPYRVVSVRIRRAPDFAHLTARQLRFS